MIKAYAAGLLLVQVFGVRGANVVAGAAVLLAVAFEVGRRGYLAGVRHG